LKEKDGIVNVVRHKRRACPDDSGAEAQGIVASVKEAVVQGICDYYDDLFRRDLRRLEA